jgi:hypothetical protein
MRALAAMCGALLLAGCMLMPEYQGHARPHPHCEPQV